MISKIILITKKLGKSILTASIWPITYLASYNKIKKYQRDPLVKMSGFLTRISNSSNQNEEAFRRKKIESEDNKLMMAYGIHDSLVVQVFAVSLINLIYIPLLISRLRLDENFIETLLNECWSFYSINAYSLGMILFLNYEYWDIKPYSISEADVYRDQILFHSKN